MMRDTHILLADDHAFVRNSIKRLLLAQENGFHIHEAVNGVDVLHLLSCKTIDLILLDIQMPQLNGLETLKQIKTLRPQVKTIVLTQLDEHWLAPYTIAIGADSFLSKVNTGLDELLDQITISLKMNETNPEVGEKPIHLNTHHILNITKREYQIISQLCKGRTTKEIAKHLGLEVYTIESYKKKLMQKNNCRNTAELVAFAFQMGLIDLARKQP
jgi:two-component system, NarL family, invasion response regulator UvrY